MSSARVETGATRDSGRGQPLQWHEHEDGGPVMDCHKCDKVNNSDSLDQNYAHLLPKIVNGN